MHITISAVDKHGIVIWDDSVEVADADEKLAKALGLQNMLAARNASDEGFISRLQYGLPILLALSLDDDVSSHEGLPDRPDVPDEFRAFLAQLISTVRGSSDGNC
jgi:hypothetical protein